MSLLAIVLVMLIAACSANSTETFSEVGGALGSGDGADAGREVTGSTTAASGEATGEATDLPPEEGEGEDDMGSGGITPVVLPSDFGRDIIYTADVAVAVTDVASAGEEASRAISGLGGFLFAQRTVGSPEPMSILTFKIQPESFQQALSRIGEIGEVRSQTVSADDVTERVVDLESRINTAAASVERLRSLLANASDIETIVELENELLARETELEGLRGSLRTLQEQVSLATIVLTLTEAQSRPTIEVVMTGYPTHDQGASCPGSEEFQVETDTETTVCVSITNVGDTLLTDFEVRDPVLDVTLDDMIVVFGELDRPLEPGESMMLAMELLPERDLRSRTTVTATPVDEDGEELPGTASTTVGFFIDTVDPGGIPGFGDGLDASWDLLVALGRLALLVAGAVLPFLWVPIVVWMGFRLWRSRNGIRPADDPESVG
ncbi:MAG TPA: DUF4349 domain-containing protein [Acidimicrobiia bacterium]|jgi:hypothetical protein|nr:DUF4349 domain-containing protein [Acidimicrobiia bacterium]